MPVEQYKKYTENQYIQGAGYKLYLMKYGIIGTFLIFLFYYTIYRKSQNRKLMCSMLIVYILAFLQRAYPFWTSWIMIFTCATALPLQEDENDEDEDEEDDEDDRKDEQPSPRKISHLPFDFFPLFRGGERL